MFEFGELFEMDLFFCLKLDLSFSLYLSAFPVLSLSSSHHQVFLFLFCFLSVFFFSVVAQRPTLLAVGCLTVGEDEGVLVVEGTMWCAS